MAKDKANMLNLRVIPKVDQKTHWFLCRMQIV